MPNRKKNYNYRLNNDKGQVEANYSQINKGEMQINKKIFACQQTRYLCQQNIILKVECKRVYSNKNVVI